MTSPMASGQSPGGSCRFLRKRTFSPAVWILPFLLAGSLNTGVAAQSSADEEESRSFAPAVTEANPFAEPEQAELFDEVLANLRKMKRTPSSRYDSSLREDDDWFVVGGSLTNPANGYIEANFNVFQGVDDVARRIVEFQYGKYGNRIPQWRVYNRTDDVELAELKTRKQAESFQRWLTAQAEKRAKWQQLLAQQQRAQQQRPSRPRKPGGC